MRRAHISLAAHLGAAMALLAGLPSATDGQERVELGGGRVAVHNLAGEVNIRSGSGSDVIVSVSRGGSDASELQLDRRTIDGAEVLVIVYPGDEFVYPRWGSGSRSEFEIADDGRLDDRDRRVRVRGSGRGLEAYADLTITVPDGKELAIYQGVGEIEVTGVTADLLLDTHSGKVSTSGTRGFLSIDTGSGSIRVVDARGDLRADTGSGGITVEQISGEDVLIDTGSGGVTGSGIEASGLRVDTGSGGIRLSRIRAEDVFLDTGSGSVEVELLSDVSALEIDTGSGGVTVRMPSTISADIEVETGSGGIDFDFPITVSRVERSHLIGRIGDGRGVIKIDTGSGSVRLIKN